METLPAASRVLPPEVVAAASSRVSVSVTIGSMSTVVPVLVRNMDRQAVATCKRRVACAGVLGLLEWATRQRVLFANQDAPPPSSHDQNRQSITP